MAEAMKGVTKAMGKMNAKLNLPALHGIMREFEKQNERMEMTSDTMGDAIDDALEVHSSTALTRTARMYQDSPQYTSSVQTWFDGFPKVARPSAWKPVGRRALAALEGKVRLMVRQALGAAGVTLTLTSGYGGARVQSEGEEEETEELVNQVLDEIGISLDTQLVSAPSTVGPVAAAAPAAPVAEAADSGIDTDLQDRLNNLRR